MQDAQNLAKMSVDDLYEAAAAAGVLGRSSMNKAALIVALTSTPKPKPKPTPNRSPKVTPKPKPTAKIDPKLVALRDELRKREAAETKAVPVRPPVSIDKKLIADRESARAADAKSSVAVTATLKG
jgi:hypothetical protein